MRQLQGQIERVQGATMNDRVQENEDDAGTFMTRVSEDGDADKKRNMKPPAFTSPVTANDSEKDRAMVLPELTPKG